MTYQAANQLATVDEKVVQFDANGNMLLGTGEVNVFDSRVILGTQYLIIS